MPLLDDPWLPAPDEYGNIPNVRPPAPVAVYRFDGSTTLTLLPNVECLSIPKREGTDPGSAQFRYNLASGLSGAPVSIETALGTGSSGTYIINSGDRLVVQGTQPGGAVENLFDGLAVTFSMGLDPDTEEVYIGAVGIAWHCWDDVINGAIIRRATEATTATDYDVPTSVYAQFNPQGQPNCTPDGSMSGTNDGDGMDFRHPVFLDPLVIQKPTDQRTQWTLNKALRYILYTENSAQTYVNNPDGTYLDGLLVSPSDDGDTTEPITSPDTPITGKDWPVTVNKLVSECGFGTSFDLSTKDDGTPQTNFNVFGQQAGTLKSLYLAPRGSVFSPTTFNFNSSGLSRDLSDVVNQWTVIGAPDRYEASFILQPAFPMQAGDKALATLKTFDKADPAYIAGNRYAYRLYILDECDEGYYNPGRSTNVTSSNTLDKLFGEAVDDVPKYAGRRRVPIGTLITLEPATGKPYEARLAISTNYTGSAGYGTATTPGLWDGSGTWQQVTTTTWRMTSDRLGIEITDSNPNSWEIGEPTVAGMPFPGKGIVHGVEAQATTGATNFVLRLTCVVEADVCLNQVAEPGGGSPLSQTINRVIDASDRFVRQYVDYPSEFNPTSGATITARDDSTTALAEAQAIRYGTENGELSGPVTIPRLTTYYKIGDRIQQIEGRDLGLRTDNGTGTPIYPVVVGVTLNLGPDGQSTVLELSDAGTDRTKYKRQQSRRKMSPTADLSMNSMTGYGGMGPGELQGGGGGGVAASPRTGYESSHLKRNWKSSAGGYQGSDPIDPVTW